MPSEAEVNSAYVPVETFKSFPATFPTYPQLTAYIRSKVLVTWPDLAKKYKQEDDTIILGTRVDEKGRREILAHGVNDLFFRYVAKFMEEDYVMIHTNPILYMMAGGPLLAALPKDTLFLFLTMSIKD